MAFCTNCGSELADGAKFCANCGTSAIAKPVPNKIENREKTVYDGRIYKCPNCGEQLDSFVTSCPSCGYELRGAQTTSYVHELSQKLELTGSIDKRIELIRNFYIPNTKEDIYEFFILAYSNITAGTYGYEAWKVKLEQAYLKAKFAFGEGSDFKHINDLYKQIKKASIQANILRSKWFKATLVFSIGLVLMLIGFLTPAVFSIESNNILGPLYFIGMMGILPFLAGIIMFIIPERRKSTK